MEKFKEFYRNNIGLDKFLYTSFILCVVGDLLHAVYARKVWLSKNAFHQLFLKMLVVNGINPSELSTTDIAEGEGVLYMTIWSLLIGFIVINSVFYFMFAKQKAWGISYTKFMVYTSLVLTGLGFLGELINFNVWSLTNLAQILIYIYVGIGFLSFPELKIKAK